MMLFKLKPPKLSLLFGLLLLCSCTTAHSIRPPPPRDVALNKDAGQGQLIFVTLRLDSGEELPFVVDTGAPFTLLDKSLVAKLGKPQGKATLWHFGIKAESDLYAAPKLYLGSTPLEITRGYIAAYEVRAWVPDSSRPIMGILGIDCLQNYCIQLDFRAGRMRFLDAKQPRRKSWGEKFSLTDFGDGRPFIRENLVGLKDSGTPATLVDTGCDADGWLATNLFQQWTNHSKTPATGEARAPDGVLGGATYPALLTLGEYGDSNGIGLLFLSQHLVTFDFPNRTMYLKRTRLPKPEGFLAAQAALKLWIAAGELPGWAKGDSGSIIGASFVPDAVTWKIRRHGDSSTYCYQATRTSEHSPWKLRKASKLDQHQRTICEYPVP